MIRPALEEDFKAIESVAASTNMFLGDELAGFMSELRGLLSGHEDQVNQLLVVTGIDSQILGVAYFGLEQMAQGVMNLYFIGVEPEAQRKGVGQQLLEACETAALEEQARLVIIETASDDMFAPAWALYRNNGYLEEARVRDYYDAGLDKLIFRKSLKSK